MLLQAAAHSLTDAICDCLQSQQRRIRQWTLLYGIQALADKWRSLERRKDRQRQAFDAAIALATDPDFQQSLENAKDQIDQAESIEVIPCAVPHQFKPMQSRHCMTLLSLDVEMF